MKSPRDSILPNFLNSGKGHPAEPSSLPQLTWTWSILPLSRMWTKKNLEPKRRMCITRPEELSVAVRYELSLASIFFFKHTSHSDTVIEGAQFFLGFVIVGRHEIVDSDLLVPM